MSLIGLIFELGVLFACYGFIWFFINLILRLASLGTDTPTWLSYIIQTLRYLFLVNLVLLFIVDQKEINLTKLIPALLILVFYFIGKFQQKSEKSMRIKIFGRIDNFHPKTEITSISIALLVFVGLIFYPDFARNNIAMWFHDTIVNLRKMTLLGFFFDLFGFFFLLQVFFKMINSLNAIIMGKPLFKIKSKVKVEKNDFDDFEEIE